MFALLIGAAERGEALRIALSGAPDALLLEASLPMALAGRSLAELRVAALGDGGGPDAPPVGFGFSFRLLEATALAAGVRLTLGESALSLSLATLLRPDVRNGAGA